jgi:type I restriction enzyme, S subunit
MKLPETWVEARLGDVLTRVESKIDPQASRSDSHFYVGLEHIEPHTGRLLQEVAEVTEGSDILSIKTAFKEGDILYGKLRPNLNKVLIASQDGISSTDIWALRTSEALLPEFALRYLRSPATYIRAAQFAVGANLPRISAEAFDRIPIPVPSRPEQQRIVNLLLHFEELREAKTRAIKLCSDLGFALFEKHFGIAGATDQWSMKTFGEFTTYSKYGPRFPDQAYSETGIHVLRTTDMNTDGTIRWWEAPKLALTEKQVREHALKPGTLVVSRSGSIGPFALFDGPENQCVAGAYLIEFGLADSIEPEYVRALFATPYMQRMLLKAVRSGAQPNINAPNIRSIQIPIPSRERQEAFSKEIRELREWTKRLTNSVKAFDAFGKVIVAEAFSGNLTAEWRDMYAEEAAKAATERDTLMRGRDVKRTSSVDLALAPAQADSAKYLTRHWLLDELSEFQRQVLAAFTTYCHAIGGPLFVEDPDLFARFCEDAGVADRVQSFGASHGNRIRRTLSQLAALGLVAKVTLLKVDPERGDPDYLKAFRPLRDEEFTRMADLQALRNALSTDSDQERYFFQAQLDYETSERAGAGDMFQVISIEDDEGKDYTHLVDQGQHYASLDDLKVDLARALKVAASQIDLEAV